MKKVIIFVVGIALLISCTACNFQRSVNMPEIKDFNKDLKATFHDVKRVKTHMFRPAMFWDIHVRDNTNTDEIFQYIVKFLKTTNIFEEKIKDYRPSCFIWATGITITFYYKGDVVRRYEGHYYSQIPNHTHDIDNFDTWIISEGRGEPGARYDIGTYKYDQG